MGKVSFQQATTGSNSYPNSSQVEFFSLKNNGDEAVVRFMHDTTDSFDILSVHTANVDGKYRKISCVRDAHDPIDNCPLCASGNKLETKFYIHLIQYVKDANGNNVAQPKVWERSMYYANLLASYINEYGPLSDCIFKIKRNGASGDIKTTYDIMFAPPQVYSPELYPKHEELFDGFNVLGTIVLDKTADEIRQFMVSGQFPQREKVQEQTSASQQIGTQAYNPAVTYVPSMPTTAYSPSQVDSNYTQRQAQPYAEMRPVDQMPPQSVTVPVTYSPSVQSPTTAPWERNTPVVSRPVRTY